MATPAEQAARAALNHSIPGQACHHNLAYWLNADYLACGAGAHGHSFPQRYSDILGIDAMEVRRREREQAGALQTLDALLDQLGDCSQARGLVGFR